MFMSEVCWWWSNNIGPLSPTLKTKTKIETLNQKIQTKLQTEISTKMHFPGHKNQICILAAKV